MLYTPDWLMLTGLIQLVQCLAQRFPQDALLRPGYCNPRGNIRIQFQLSVGILQVDVADIASPPFL